jgi:hypothetical protein
MPTSIDASQFVGNFLNTYFAVKQSRDAEKQKKYEPIIAAVMDRIKSDDTTYTQKTALTKSLFTTLGIKTDESVSQLFSEIENQDKQLVKTKEGNEGQLPIIQSDYSNQKPSVELQKGITPTPDEFIERGSLTPYEYKDLIRQKTEDRALPRELAKKRELIKLQSEADLEELKVKGYKDLGLFKDKDGSWFNLFSNPITGDERRIPLPKDALPESVVNKQIQAQSGGIGGLAKQLSWAYGIKAQAESDPNSVTAAQLQAADKVIENQNVNVGLKQANTAYAQQGVEGTRRTQPAQQESLGLQREGMDLRKSEIVSNLEQEATKGETKARELQQTVNDLEAQLTSTEALLGIRTDEDELKELQTRADRLRDDLRIARKDLAIAFSEGAAATKALQKQKGQSTNTSLNPAQSQAVQTFRKNNANNPKAQSMSDSEILNYLMSLRQKKTIRRR